MSRFASPYPQYDLVVAGHGIVKTIKFENGVFVTDDEQLAEAMRKGRYFGVNYFEVKEKRPGRKSEEE